MLFLTFFLSNWNLRRRNVMIQREYKITPYIYKKYLQGGSLAREARVGQSLILIEYGQPLFFWLSRD